MLRVKLFGVGEAEYCERLLEGFPQQQAYMLLCYLLLNKDHSHSRERLATVLWGNSSNSLARKYFRNTLWRLRHMLSSTGMPVDDYLLVQSEQVAFNVDCPYWLDVDILENTATQYAHIPPQQLDPDQATQLSRAAELYTGDLLECVYEDWCLYNRERLRLIYLNLQGKLLEYFSFSGAYDRALVCGECILALDNTREDVHRQMMWMYWQTGNHYAALNQYKLCCQILQDELGIPPMEATRQLYEKMMRHQIDVSTGEGSHSPSWVTFQDSGSGMRSFAKQVIQKLQDLEKTILATNAEVEQLKELIYKLYSGKYKP